MSASKVYGIKSQCDGHPTFYTHSFTEGDITNVCFTDKQSDALRLTRAEADAMTQSFPILGRVVILRGLASQPDSQEKE